VRWRVIVPVVAVVLVGLLLFREEGPGAAGPPPPVPRAPAPAAPLSSAPLPVSPRRNVFAYGATVAPESAPPAAKPPSLPAPVPTLPAAPPPPVRLVGVVQQGGALKAAIALGGEVVMLGVGEERGGYRVESIDEESGVRVAGPGGNFWVLVPE
jgi:hypothetical protein